VVVADHHYHQEVGWEMVPWWCCGVVVVIGERMCRGVRSVDVKKNLLFFSVVFERGGSYS
jgi:hypothetical protein